MTLHARIPTLHAAITVDSDGYSWFTEFKVSYIDRLTVTGTIAQLLTPINSPTISREKQASRYRSPWPENGPPIED